MEDYLDAVTEIHKAVVQRTNLDATPASLGRCYFCGRGSRVISLAEEGAKQTPPEKDATGAMKIAAAAMLSAAQAEYQGLLELEGIRPRVPEFMELRIASSRRLLDGNFWRPRKSRGTEKGVKKIICTG